MEAGLKIQKGSESEDVRVAIIKKPGRLDKGQTALRFADLFVSVLSVIEGGNDQKTRGANRQRSAGICARFLDWQVATRIEAQ